MTSNTAKVRALMAEAETTNAFTPRGYELREQLLKIQSAVLPETLALLDALNDESVSGIEEWIVGVEAKTKALQAKLSEVDDE